MIATSREKGRLPIFTAALLAERRKECDTSATTWGWLRLSRPLSWKGRATAKQSHVMARGGRHPISAG